MPFQDNFADWMTDVLTVTPGAPNVFGDFIPSGAVLTIPCRATGRMRLVRGSNGREIVSSCSVEVLGQRGLSSDRHRYTLPARFTPNAMLEAIAIEKIADEVEVVAERLSFP